MEVGRQHVAFFRNMNLGQHGSPTRALLLDAFAAAGAVGAASFQSNGTALFTAADPAAVTADVCAWLLPACGYRGLAIVRTARWVRSLRPELVVGADALARAEVSLFDLTGRFSRPLPSAPAGRPMTVVRADRRHAVVVNDESDRSYGTRVLERLLGVPVTSRGVATMVRLAAWLASRAV